MTDRDVQGGWKPQIGGNWHCARCGKDLEPEAGAVRTCTDPLCPHWRVGLAHGEQSYDREAVAKSFEFGLEKQVDRLGEIGRALGEQAREGKE